MLDDLNPLYVYEAKMSLLVRMAQTRQGAERLLEARVLPILADCDYLDARDRKSTRLNSSHSGESRMPSSA